MCPVSYNLRTASWLSFNILTAIETHCSDDVDSSNGKNHYLDGCLRIVI